MPSLPSNRLGVLMGIAAYSLWGVLPLYLRALKPLGAADILSYRILWSLALLVLLALLFGRMRAAWAAIRRPRIAIALLASTLLIGGNWLLYIYSVNSGHTIQASLGYYVNPLVNVLLGVAILRERLGWPEMIAIGLAAVGVAALTIAQHALPLIPLGLALSFALYGLIRKMIGVAPVDGLLVETGLLAPFAFAWLLFGALPAPAGVAPPLWLLMISGAMTTVPLLLFNGAARRVRYTDLGLLQYIGPTIQLVIAVRIFGEPLLPIHILTFTLIWTGLAIYAVASWHRGRMTAALPE